jgi:hypothetical protein
VSDAALEWFRQDQKASGLSVREYERLHGVFLSDPDEPRPLGRLSDISMHETPMSEGQDKLERQMLGSWDDSAYSEHLAHLRSRRRR